MQDTACLELVHGDDPERCYGEGGGRGIHVWERMQELKILKFKKNKTLKKKPKIQQQQRKKTVIRLLYFNFK